LAVQLSARPVAEEANISSIIFIAPNGSETDAIEDGGASALRHIGEDEKREA
jgi:hypothetical protein